MDEKLSFSKKNIYTSISLLLIILLFNPYEKIQFILPIFILALYIFKHKNNLFTYFKHKIRSLPLLKVLIALFVYQFCNYLFALLDRRADVLTFPLFFVTFWLTFVFLLLPNTQNCFLIKKCLKILIIIQGLVIIYQGINRGNFFPKDWPKGFLPSAHLTGFCFIWILFATIFEGSFKRENILVIFFSSILLFFTDSKTLITVGLLLAPFVFIIIFARKLAPGTYLRSALFYVILSVILFLNFSVEKIQDINLNNKQVVLDQKGQITTMLTNFKFKIYLKNYSPVKLKNTYVNGSMNHKALFIRNGFQYLLKNNLLLTGTSPGTLGSRASNVRAGDTLYKPLGLQLSFLENYTTLATRDVYSGLFTQEYHKTAKSYIKTLALPFSSLFSFFFENGIIGSIIFLFFIFFLLKFFLLNMNRYAIENIFLLSLVFFWGIFDTVWERPFVTGMLYLIIRTNYLMLNK